MLQGKIVLDLTWVLGGPFAGQLLAQLGAEVIKIEPVGGDYARSVPPVSDTQESPFFLSVNRGKRSVALDLKHPLGRQAFQDLVREADAVIYGFASDVPARLGLDHGTLAAVNPRIVVGQLIGLDDRGAYAGAPAFDLMLQAMSGLMSITGEAGGKPVRVGYQVADLAGGLYLALGVAAGLVQAQASGVGERVQVSLFDAQMAMLTWQAQGYLQGGAAPRASGARHAMIAPSDIYRTADGRWIALAPTGDAFWKALCVAIERPEMAIDARFATPAARVAHVEALTDVLADAIGRRDSRDWLDIFEAKRVPAALVLTVDEALEHPLVASRGMLESVARPQGGEPVRMLGNPFKFDGQPQLGYPPVLGQDTAELLRTMGGHDEASLAALQAAGVIRIAGAVAETGAAR